MTASPITCGAVIISIMDQTVPTQVATIEKKIFTGAAGKILNMLASGVLPHEAAKACGVSEAYVSQLNADPAFDEQLKQKIAKNFADQSAIDENYNNIERTLSERLMKNVDLEFNTDKILRILKFTNEAKRRIPINGNNGGEPGGAGNNGQKPTTLIFPTQIIQQFITNPNNEIVGIDGKELVTASSTQLKELAEKRLQERSKLLPNKTHGSRQTDPYSDL